MNLPSLPSLPSAGGAATPAPPPVDGPEVELSVRGMHCASCVGRIESALGKVPGVSLAVVDLLSGRARVRLSDPAVPVQRLVEAVAGAGYEAREAEKADLFGLEELVDAEQAERAAALRDLSLRLAVAVAVALPVATLSMADVAFPGRDALFLVLTAVVLGFSGREILASGARAAARLAPDMNTLVALGTSSAFLTSAAATFFPHLFHVPGGHAPVYYEAAVVIVALVLLGRFLEERAKGKAGEAIRALARLGARQARLVRPGGDAEVPLERVRAGDLLRVLPGEKVPTDGVLVEGATAVDESLVTGESIPVEKVPGDAAPRRDGERERRDRDEGDARREGDRPRAGREAREAGAGDEGAGPAPRRPDRRGLRPRRRRRRAPLLRRLDAPRAGAEAPPRRSSPRRPSSSSPAPARSGSRRRRPSSSGRAGGRSSASSCATPASSRGRPASRRSSSTRPGR